MGIRYFFNLIWENVNKTKKIKQILNMILQAKKSPPYQVFFKWDQNSNYWVFFFKSFSEQINHYLEDLLEYVLYIRPISMVLFWFIKLPHCYIFFFFALTKYLKALQDQIIHSFYMIYIRYWWLSTKFNFSFISTFEETFYSAILVFHACGYAGIWIPLSEVWLVRFHIISTNW